MTTAGAITFVSGGTCSLTAAQAGNATFAAATSVTQTFPITAGVNTISFPARRPRRHQPAADARRIGQLGSHRELHVELDRRVHGDAGCAITFVSTGTCSITATQAGNANYAAATPVLQSFPILPAPTRSPSRAAGHTAHQSAAGARPRPAPVSPSAIVELDRRLHSHHGRRPDVVSAGTCSITAAQAGNASCVAATPVTQTFPLRRAST